MKRARLASAFLLCVVLLAACGGSKDDKGPSVDLPQPVSFFDDTVSFSLPQGWVAEHLPDSPGLDFLITNSQALYNDTPDKTYFSNFATGAFVYAYDPTYVLKDSDLGIKSNVVVGAGVVMDLGSQDAKKSPTEIVQFFYDQAAGEVTTLGTDEEIAANKAWFDLKNTKIKTFKDGALARFNTAGGLTGVLGVVRTTQNFCMVFLVTDQPDQYLDTFEAIIRSIKVPDGALPELTATPTPTSTSTPTITPTPSITPTPLITVAPVKPTATSAVPMTPLGVTPLGVTPLSIEPIEITPLPVEPAHVETAVHVETPVSVEPVRPTPTPTPTCEFVVQAGDSLFSIAAQLDVSPSDLTAANPSVGNGSQLQVGDVLTIPGCP